MAYVKPVRPMFIVAPDKAKEFTMQKPDVAAKIERKRLVSLLKKSNEGK